jgi:hypothetical protein
MNGAIRRRGVRGATSNANDGDVMSARAMRSFSWTASAAALSGVSTSASGKRFFTRCLH